MTVALTRARELVLRFGWNSTAYQLLNPGFRHWFSSSGDGLVGYAAAGGSRVAAGAPVCAAGQVAAVAREFEADSRARGARVCWLGAGGRFAGALDDRAHPRACVGAEPWWDPQTWDSIVAERASVRAQLRRGANKGVAVSEWPDDRARADARLRACLTEWLGRQHLPPLHFLVEPRLLDRLLDRRLFVAERDGRPIAYLVLTPVPAREGWLVEQIVRTPGAPNGTTELLVDAGMRAAAAGGSRWVTLGVAPLSSRAADLGGPLWLRAALGWARAHGRRFYNFGGLETFKAKFRPAGWDPVWLVGTDGALRPRDLWAVASAYAGGSPAGALVQAMVKAAGEERRRAWRRARRLAA